MNNNFLISKALLLDRYTKNLAYERSVTHETNPIIDDQSNEIMLFDLEFDQSQIKEISKRIETPFEQMKNIY